MSLELKERYLVDESGSRVAVLLDICEIDDAGQTVTVLHVGHRRDIYK